MPDNTPLFKRFITAWLNFCSSVVTLQSNEKAFQAWFAAALIQEFGLARVYREVHLDKWSLQEHFSPRLEAVFGELYRKLKMHKHELLPDVCISIAPEVDTRHTVARVPELQSATELLKRMSVVTEFKVAASSKNATQYSKVYIDILKLGLLRNAVLAVDVESRLPLPFMCVLDNVPQPQDATYIEHKYVRRLLVDGQTWPKGWEKPTLLVTAPIGNEWVSYVVDGSTDWHNYTAVARWVVR